MATKTRTPNTAARAKGIPPDVEIHTKAMLESILRPHSLEELYALVGSFPFKAVKVTLNPEFALPNAVALPVGTVIEVLNLYDDRRMLTNTEGRITDKLSRQWRLAGD